MNPFASILGRARTRATGCAQRPRSRPNGTWLRSACTRRAKNIISTSRVVAATCSPNGLPVQRISHPNMWIYTPILTAVSQERRMDPTGAYCVGRVTLGFGDSADAVDNEVGMYATWAEMVGRADSDRKADQ